MKFAGSLLGMDLDPQVARAGGGGWGGGGLDPQDPSPNAFIPWSALQINDMFISNTCVQKRANCVVEGGQ